MFVIIYKIILKMMIEKLVSFDVLSHLNVLLLRVLIDLKVILF